MTSGMIYTERKIIMNEEEMTRTSYKYRRQELLLEK